MKTGVKKFLKKLPDLAFITLIIAVLIFGLLKTVFLPKDINYYENRKSEKIIFPTFKNISEQKFQNSIEKSLADQIPKAQTLKKMYNLSTAIYIDTMVRTVIESNPDVYINYLGVKLFGSDQIVYSFRDLNTLKPDLNAKAENYNSLIESYPDIEFYAYFIEKDTDINFETGEKLGAGEYMFNLLNLPDTNKAIFKINSYNDFRESFYRTDHHWNHKGSYKAYLEVLDLLGIKDEPIKHSEEILVSKEFSGSKAASAGANTFKEDFFAYQFDYPEIKVTINGEQADDYGEQDEYFSDNKPSKITYGDFYGWDNGETIFESSNDERDNILIFGESYDNAILKLLATHYNTIYSIDMRTHKGQIGKEFNFSDYVKSHKIDKVLFIGNVDFYTMKEFILEND